MESFRTDDGSENHEDYIIEDPVRMTRQFIEKFGLARDGVNGNNDSRIEMENILNAMLKNSPTPTAPFATSADSQSDSEDEHSDFDDIGGSHSLEPTEKIPEEETMPWSKDFNDEMWSNWDDSSYTDHFSEDKTDSTDVFGRKQL